MVLITTLVLCARPQDSLTSASVRRVYIVFSTLLNLSAEESRVLRHVKPPRCGEASRKASRTSLGSNPSHWCTSSRLDRMSYPSASVAQVTCSLGISHCITRPKFVFYWNSRARWVCLLKFITNNWPTAKSGEICL